MKTIYIDNTILTKDKKDTYLSADVSSGASTITVQSITGFAIDQILLISEIEQEKTEIIKTHASTSPTGTTITLASNLIFDHPQDTKVYIIDWDQVEISWASTTTGTKSVLDTIDIQVDQKETLYDETTKSSGYYFTRFKNTIDTIYSSYSDAVPYAGYADNTVFMIKKRALDSIDETIGELITHEFLNEALWQGRREYHDAIGKRPFRRIFNKDIGNVTTGMFKIAAPSDLEDSSSGRNLYGIRIGTEMNMSKYDKKEWDQDFRGIPRTTLASDYAVVDAAITLTDSRDFDESGTIDIDGDTIEYSANNESTGELTVSTAGDSAHSEDDTVLQNANYGLPTKFVVFTSADGSNYIFFNYCVHSDYVDQNVYGDYYKTVTAYDSDADVLDEPEFDMFVPYLAYRIKKKKEPKLRIDKDSDYLLWITRKSSALKNEYLGTEIKFVPDVPC